MTQFAEKVYKVVLGIPFGQTRSYKWVAQKAGRPGAHRAVGTILKRNPFPLIVPCHRVIKSDNEAGGYAFGIRNKRIILDLEKEILRWLANKE